MGFFDDLTNWWDDTWNSIVGQFDGIVEAVEEVLNIKEIAIEEFDAVIEEMSEVAKGSEDFAERVRTLRGKVVRADVAFQLIDDIRSGQLRQFLKIFQDLKVTFDSGFQEVLEAGRNIGLVKSTPTGGPAQVLSKVLDVIHGICKGYKILAVTAHAMHEFVPIIKEIREKLDGYEDIIMQQGNQRHARRRKGVTRKRVRA